MINLEQLRFGYNGGNDVLRLDEFHLDPESNVLVVGPSGCGKTTLLHLIAGLLLPTQGRVSVDGQDLAQLSPPGRDRFRGRHIGIVLQQFHLLPTLTAMQNLLVAQSIAGLPVDRAAAHAMLRILGVDERIDAFPHQLSVGQQQRVAIARALVNRPKLVLADEPTSSLDSRTSIEIMAIFQRLNREQGISTIVVTHEPDIAAYANRNIHFRDGRVVVDDRIARPRQAEEELAGLPQEETVEA